MSQVSVAPAQQLSLEKIHPTVDRKNYFLLRKNKNNYKKNTTVSQFGNNGVMAHTPEDLILPQTHILNV